VSAPGARALERRTILAMGGGGFTMEPANPLLDDYLLTLTGAAEPKVLFLPTASGDTNAQINAFYARYGGRRCVPKHVSLFRLDELDGALEDAVLEQDIVYVGGGSMRNLLAIWRAHELDRILVDSWRRGIVMAGLSAGAMCWFEGGVTRSGGTPEPTQGLGLLPGSLTVHADGEPERLPVWLACVRSGTLPGGWAADDGVGLRFRGPAPGRSAWMLSKASSCARASSLTCWEHTARSHRRWTTTCASCAASSVSAGRCAASGIASRTSEPPRHAVGVTE
jgi:peptidase E